MWKPVVLVCLLFPSVCLAGESDTLRALEAQTRALGALASQELQKPAGHAVDALSGTPPRVHHAVQVYPEDARPSLSPAPPKVPLSKLDLRLPIDHPNVDLLVGGPSRWKCPGAGNTKVLLYQNQELIGAAYGSLNAPISFRAPPGEYQVGIVQLSTSCDSVRSEYAWDTLQISDVAQGYSLDLVDDLP